jgi:hypothetical protein
MHQRLLAHIAMTAPRLVGYKQDGRDGTGIFYTHRRPATVLFNRHGGAHPRLLTYVITRNACLGTQPAPSPQLSCGVWGECMWWGRMWSTQPPRPTTGACLASARPENVEPTARPWFWPRPPGEHASAVMCYALRVVTPRFHRPPTGAFRSSTLSASGGLRACFPTPAGRTTAAAMLLAQTNYPVVVNTVLLSTPRPALATHQLWHPVIRHPSAPSTPAASTPAQPSCSGRHKLRPMQELPAQQRPRATTRPTPSIPSSACARGQGARQP